MALLLVLSSGVSKAAEESLGTFIDDPRARVLICTPQGPVIVQVSLTIEGLPYQYEAERIVEEQFALIENPAWSAVFENARLLGGRFMAYKSPEARAEQIAKYDRDSDGLISRRELRAALLSETGEDAIVFVHRARDVARTLGVNRDDQLLALIDTDGNWRLSAEELQQAPARIALADVSRDGILTVIELQRAAAGRVRAATLGVLLGRPDSAAAVVRELRSHYSDAQGAVTRSAFRITPSVFARLDTNGDGELQDAELSRIASLPAHIVLSMDHSDTAAHAPVHVQLKGTSSELEPDSQTVPYTDKMYRWENGKGELEIHAGTMEAKGLAKLRAQNTIARYDRNKGGYLDRSEAVDRADSEFRPEQFPLWDQDQDGLIFRYELEAVFQREVPLSRCWMRIEVVRRPPPLWRNADANDDSMLGAREIRNLVRQLSDCDADGDGEVAYHEMPFEIVVDIGRGTLIQHLSSRYISN
ncbi:MAG TPA: hypothetical protein VHB77_22400, partial [Planctomycetaceae bacterium]|nr:hypothetical protein [Planctomycetaceae bacterium]